MNPAVSAPPPPTSPTARLRWALADGLTIVRRNLGHLRHRPGELIAGLISPVILVVLFGYVFGSAIEVPGGGNYRDYLMPGLFGMTTIVSIGVSAVDVASDRTNGVMDRFRSMPIARSAVPFGQVGGDTSVGAVGLAVMAAVGLLVGWRAHSGVLPALGAFALLLFVRYAIGWIGVYIGLAVPDEQTADSIVPLVFPLSMVSNSFVPTAGMPAWLRLLADWNPVSAVVAACRQLFATPGVPTHPGAWPLRHPIIASIAWGVLILAAFVPLSVHRYTSTRT